MAAFPHNSSEDGAMRTATMAGLLVSGVLLIATPAPGQTTDSGFPYTGEVTGTDVYVRSRPDTNYYPTTKVSAPQRVTVVAERFGWLAIEPVAGSFSYIAREFVDRAADGSRGIVNADHVYVRAGSEVHPQKRSSVQMQLSRGAEVEIIGEADGFYRIAPPRGARLWISGQYVKRATGEVPAPVPPTQPAPPTTRPPVTQPVRVPTTQVVPEPSRKYAEMLEAIEKDLEAEDAKPLAMQRFDDIRQRLEPIAAQTDEPVPQQIAKLRLEQIDERLAMRASLEAARRLAEDLEDTRKRIQRERLGLQQPPLTTGEEYDAVGELRASAAFRSFMPSRYRLVDPGSGRTVAYVEIPAGGAVDPQQLMGHYLGIKAKARHYDPNLRINILVPGDIVRLSRPATPTTAPTVPARGGD